MGCNCSLREHIAAINSNGNTKLRIPTHLSIEFFKDLSSCFSLKPSLWLMKRILTHFAFYYAPRAPDFLAATQVIRLNQRRIAHSFVCVCVCMCVRACVRVCVSV